MKRLTVEHLTFAR